MVIQSAEFDGLGRRVRKTVTNSGDLDGVTVYLYNGQQIIETRDGSGNVETQVYHGTRYIDEVVGLRVKDQGRVYLHQGERSERELPAIGKESTMRTTGRRACPEEARTTRATVGANWNVTAMTDLTGRVLERYWYSPYGELEAVVAAHPFDYGERSERLSVTDRGGRMSEQGCERQTFRPARRTRTRPFAFGGDDGDVDDDDYAVTTNGTCSGSATGDCRRLDANADGVVGSADQRREKGSGVVIVNNQRCRRPWRLIEPGVVCSRSAGNGKTREN